jgi:ferrochelatase
VDEVAHHYDLFGGVSPLTDLTRRQARGLASRLLDRGFDLPVFVGMRNWHPYLKDALGDMSRRGIRRAVGFVAAAHRSYSSCTQYRENVNDARAELRRDGLADVEVTYVSDWHAHPDFVDAWVASVADALQGLPDGVRDRARLIFTAHSIPASMADRYPYARQFEETARLVADGVARRLDNPAMGAARSACVYQSRSGRPEDPWLEPDVCDYLRQARADGLEAAVLCPIGFVCDHIEVLYDLDTEAAGVCRAIGLPMARARAVNDHPLFLDMMADVVTRTVRRYDRARPLPVVAS